MDKIKAWLEKTIMAAIAAAFDTWMPKVMASLREAVDAWMPRVIEAVVTAVAHAAGQLTVDSVDKVTDIIPGNLDDTILDGMVGDILGKLNARRNL